MGRFSPDEARALYAEMADSTDIVGHAACGDMEAERRFKERTSAVGNDFTIEEDPISDTADGPPSLRFRVASPWHALIHLSVNNRGWLEGRQGPIRTPLIYRGHRDATWSMVPSLLRKGTDRHREERRLRTFRTIVREALGQQVVSDAVLEATAQHYGIKTDLLDFTSDEAVAVWFACEGGSQGDIASVFALPLAVGALCDVSITLCHPSALRPYRQHGLFVRDPLNQLKSLLIEIRFPIDKRFRIRRDRLPTALLPQDEWWVAAVSAANDESANLPRSSSIGGRLREDEEESLLHLLQMLMELTTLEISRNTTFNHEVISQVSSQNGQMLLEYEERCRSVGARHFRGTMGQFVVRPMLDYLRTSALTKPSGLAQTDTSGEIATFRKWLPLYKESHGGLLSNVPTEVAREMVRVCREIEVEFEVHPQGNGTWIVHIKGARASK